jgi:hypothetical protein
MSTIGDQLSELSTLRQSGALTEEEFSAAKQRVLCGGDASPVVAQATVVEAHAVLDPKMGGGGGSFGAVAVEPVSATAYAVPPMPTMATVRATSIPNVSVQAPYPVRAPEVFSPIARATTLPPFDAVEAARDQPNVLVNRSGAIVPKGTSSLLDVKRTEHGLIVTSPLKENKGGIVRVDLSYSTH